MKVLVTGSRDWRDEPMVLEALQKVGVTMLIHGAARGADIIAARAARTLGLPEDAIRGYPADWAMYGRAAGGIRNSQMIREEHLPSNPIDICIAFPLPTSIGTHDMMRKALAAGIHVWVPAREEYKG